MNLCLNNQWKLAWRELSWTANRAADMLAASDYIHAGSLPLDVHMPLQEQGIIADPVVADNCFACEWTENKSWWFLRTFTLTEQALAAEALTLVLESLDAYADIFVNGKHLGTHRSAHFPFRAELKGIAASGDNTLLVRLTSGLELVDDQIALTFAPYNAGDRRNSRRGDERRPFLRKPQYAMGWDWGPRVVTTGIVKNAWLEIKNALDASQLHVITTAIGDQATLRIEAEIDNLHPYSTAEGQLELTITAPDGTTVHSQQSPIYAQSGVNYETMDVTIANPQLWWPNGAIPGREEQPLYTAKLVITQEGKPLAARETTFGIRTIALDTSPCEGGRRFALCINGKNIYCKGGNWIPADSVYARVTREKYESLVDEAAECNFNMLRIWGGGIYECDAFYQACDRRGILIWHDFMFSCQMAPDGDSAYLDLCRREADYQTRRLRNHPSMALWCGNNENHWLNIDPMLKDGCDFQAGQTLYNYTLAEAVRRNAPEMPYWRSSPYGGEHPNDNEHGDRHHWGDCTMNEDMQKRITPEEYDKVTSRFVSEYGYIGPCSDETIAKYFGDKPIDPDGDIWKLHNNEFEKDTVPAGIRKHYADPENLTKSEYFHWARLVQGLMYAYSLEAIRCVPENAGSLFWMYNDTWGEVGWTIIDYYLDRKPSYYFVKRAFAPVKLILRAADGQVRVHGSNDTVEPVTFALEYGTCGMADNIQSQTTQITIPPMTKGIVHTFPMPNIDPATTLVFARGGPAPLALLRTGDHRNKNLSAPQITIANTQKQGDDLLVTLRTDTYAHAVHLTLPASAHLSDNWFDLLPGQEHTITIKGGATIAPDTLCPQSAQRA